MHKHPSQIDSCFHAWHRSLVSFQSQSCLHRFLRWPTSSSSPTVILTETRPPSSHKSFPTAKLTIWTSQFLNSERGIYQSGRKSLDSNCQHYNFHISREKTSSFAPRLPLTQGSSLPRKLTNVLYTLSDLPSDVHKKSQDEVPIVVRIKCLTAKCWDTSGDQALTRGKLTSLLGWHKSCWCTQ